MKKLLAAVVASAFAFGAASSFAFEAPNHNPSVQGHVVKVQKVKVHKVKHAKKHHRHHARHAR
jgi:hypothetical protein